jgi:hypothetical protein
VFARVSFNRLTLSLSTFARLPSTNRCQSPAKPTPLAFKLQRESEEVFRRKREKLRAGACRVLRTDFERVRDDEKRRGLTGECHSIGERVLLCLPERELFAGLPGLRFSRFHAGEPHFAQRFGKGKGFSLCLLSGVQMYPQTLQRHCVTLYCLVAMRESLTFISGSLQESA